MRRPKLILAAATFALAPTLLVAEDGQKMPFAPYEKAELGDWAVYETRTKQGEETKEDVELLEVVDSGAGAVTVAGRALVDTMPFVGHSAHTAKTKEIPSLAEGLGGPAPPGDMKITDEKRELGGKTFSCRLLSCTTAESGGEKFATKIWLSKDVRVGGMVGLDVKGGPLSMEKRIAGFGTKDKVQFGKTFAALVRPLLERKGDKELPANPFASAAAGDWLLLEDATTSQAGTVKTYHRVVEVVAVAGDDVQVRTRPLKHAKKWTDYTPPMPSYTYSKTKAPLVSEVLGFVATGASFADDKVTVGEKTLDVRRVSADFKNWMAKDKRGTLTLWISTETKALGLVKAEIKGTFTSAIRVLGYGSKGKTAFGKSPEEVAKDAPEEKD